MALCLRAVWTVLGVMSNYLLNAPCVSPDVWWWYNDECMHVLCAWCSGNIRQRRASELFIIPIQLTLYNVVICWAELLIAQAWIWISGTKVYLDGSGGISTHSIFLLDNVSLFVFLMFQSENSPICITEKKKTDNAKRFISKLIYQAPFHV